MSSSSSIAARNRANARKSTGPKSEDGKARAARNALRHGAVASPSKDEVLRWMAIILDVPDLKVADVDAGRSQVRRVLALAEAEARYAKAVRALREFEAGATLSEEQCRSDRDLYESILSLHRNGPGDPDLLRLAQYVSATYLDPSVDGVPRGGKRHRLLKSYVREAAAKRDAVFQAWLSVDDEHLQRNEE